MIQNDNDTAVKKKKKYDLFFLMFISKISENDIEMHEIRKYKINIWDYYIR